MRQRNKISQDVYFTKNDIVKVPRSTFYRNQDVKTTFNAGKLVPLFVDEILPGDTFELDMNSVIRFSSPLIRPVMDDVEMEAWAFFVPSRLLDDNFEKIIANYKLNPDWSSDVQETLSALVMPSNGFALHSVADYMGLPVDRTGGKEPLKYPQEKYNLLPFRAYTFIWDYYFRDENLQPAITIEGTGYQVLNGVDNIDGDYATDALRGGALCPLNKKHDLFTSALPSVLKGSIPMISIGGEAPITSKTPSGAFANVFIRKADADGTRYRPYMYTEYDDVYDRYFGRMGIFDTQGLAEQEYSTFKGVANENEGRYVDADPTWSPCVTGFDPATFPQGTWNYYTDLSTSRVYADLSQATGISVNDLRLLVQTQRLKEQDARYGSRYAEYLLGSWGVISADSRLQRPEFLGKTRFSLSVQQVIQNTESSETSAQGNPAAYSLSGNVKHLFTKSFVEHGYILVVGGVRIPHRTYSQNVNKMWSKFSRLDFYNPVYANLGEQAIKNKEIFFSDDDGDNNAVFGYQEAYYEYRHLPNRATGYMRPGVDMSLSVWNYAETYDETPTLSPEWIQEDISPIDRALSIPSETGAMFIADIFFKNKATRPMPIHSIPGLLDHSGKIIL